MTVRSNEDLLALFDDDRIAAAFGREFLKAFIVPALGVLPKTEIDLLVFTLLVRAGAVDPNGSIYALARVLNITPAKARSLIFQYQLRHVSEAETDTAVLITLAKARYWKDGTNLAFGVESPLVRAAIAAKMRERGVFTDISLSGDILKVSPDQFGEVIAALLPSDIAKALAKKLKKQGVDEGAVRKAIKDYGAKIAEDFIKDEGKGLLKDLMTNLWQGVSEHAPAALDHISDAIGAFL